MREKRGKLMKVIVVSHGSYARGLVDTAQMIAGEQEDLEAFGLEPEESVDTLREKIRESIEQTSEGEEVLILTDLHLLILEFYQRSYLPARTVGT